jgi:hypothetical protein
MGYGGTILIPWSPHGEPNIIRVIKSRTMRWVGHVAHVEVIRSAYNMLIGKPEKNREQDLTIKMDTK